MNRPGLRSVRPRSALVVAIATDHPWSTSPSTSESGTNTSSRNTSAKPSSPSRRPKPRTVTPGASSGTRRYVRPRWRSAAGSVRNRPKRWVQNAPRVVHVFWPESRQPPAASSRTPRLWMPARSEPAFGSDQPWHQRSSAAAIRGRIRSRLLLGAELEDRRGEQEDPVLGDPLRPARPVVLLLEDQPLHRRGVPPAVRLRPRDHGPAGVEQRPLPVEVEREALAGVARRQPPGHVGLEPAPALRPERLLLRREGQVHASPDAIPTVPGCPSSGNRNGPNGR